jgi:hypothetical protein
MVSKGQNARPAILAAKRCSQAEGEAIPSAATPRWVRTTPRKSRVTAQPSTVPSRAAAAPSTAASARIRRAIWRRVLPTARSRPISRRRSATLLHGVQERLPHSTRVGVRLKLDHHGIYLVGAQVGHAVIEIQYTGGELAVADAGYAKFHWTAEGIQPYRISQPDPQTTGHGRRQQHGRSLAESLQGAGPIALLKAEAAHPGVALDVEQECRLAGKNLQGFDVGGGAGHEPHPIAETIESR